MRLLLIGGDAQDVGRRASIGLTLGTKTPRDLVVGLRPHDGALALVALTTTAAPQHAAATIVVRDDVVALVGGIQAGADPRDRGHLCARRAGIDRAAVTGA